MAGKIIEVNTAILKHDVSTILGEVRGLKNDVQRLYTVAEQLSGTWDGSAKEAFVMQVQDDIRRLEELITAIGHFTDKTEKSRTEYEKCEASVADIVASICI